MSRGAIEPSNRILVIDDNPSIHEDFRKILGPEPNANAEFDAAREALFGEPQEMEAEVRFEIDSAYQGKEGLTLVQQALEEGRPYALAFVDVRMPPGWDGVETIMQLWRSYPELQVVICTAYSDYSWIEIRRHLGRSDNMVILKKPFDNIEVLQLADALTKKWFLTQQGKLKVEDLDRMVQQRTQELQAEVETRRQTEAALRISEERFEKAFTASPLAMAILTLKEARYLDVNDSFAKLTEATRQEFLGQLAPQTTARMEEPFWSRLQASLQAGQSLRHFECAWRTKTGASREALLWAELFNLGQEPYLLMIVQDITERKKLEEQLRQAQKMEAVGLLAAGVAHDFNNILTVIQGHVSLRLATDNLDREMAESLKEVSTAAERATRLTRQLLAFSRRQVIQRKPLDLNSVVQQIGKRLCPLMGERIQLRCELQPDLPIVSADESHLEQVIINLAVNARDAMPAGGSLTLRTAAVAIEPNQTLQRPEAEAGRFVRLSAVDTGCGIASDIRGRIFEPFFTTKAVGKGTGMGLAMVYGIVKQHGGWIEVQSEPGAGSSFDLYLPVQEAIQSASLGSPDKVLTTLQAPIPQAAGHSQASGDCEPAATILVVEDEPALQELLKAILQRCGYRLLLANNGVEALRVWRDHQGKIDLLLTDMVMPEGISGQQLAEQLLDQNPRLKVIYSSGYAAELVDRPGEASPNHHFLSKPYHPRTLIETVRASLAA